MGVILTSAKDIRVQPIQAAVARDFIRSHHYSGRVVTSSRLSLGAFLGDRLIGVMQFGRAMYPRQALPLVADTAWDAMLELNRFAMIDDTPRNAESRTLSVACRLIRQHYPQVDWILSYADGTLCGDGTIYRAAGFVLTGIKKNATIWMSPPNELGQREYRARSTLTKGVHARRSGGVSTMKPYRDAGWEPVPGFQLRYIRFLNPDARGRLSVPELPYTAIAEAGARMYKGKRPKDSSEPLADPVREGGAAPTRTLSRVHR